MFRIVFNKCCSLFLPRLFNRLRLGCFDHESGKLMVKAEDILPCVCSIRLTLPIIIDVKHNYHNQCVWCIDWIMFSWNGGCYSLCRSLWHSQKEFTVASLHMLANHRKRQQLQALMRSLKTIKTLQRTDVRLREMLEVSSLLSDPEVDF